MQLRVELLMWLSQRKNWAWTQCETQHLPGLRHPNKDKNSNLHVIRDAPTELWNASVSGGPLGPVTQLRTGTSSTTSASGSSTDMMPINETAKSTNETGIEILCQTVLRRLHLQADVRWQRQVWTGEEMDTWQTTVWSNFIKRKKKICIQKMEEKREGIPQINLRGSFWNKPSETSLEQTLQFDEERWSSCWDQQFSDEEVNVASPFFSAPECAGPPADPVHAGCPLCGPSL